MKTSFSIFYTTLTIALAFASSAAETTSAPANRDQAGKPSPEFQRMKSLVGTWIGEVDMGGGPIDVTLQYRLLAGGSVLEERCLAGTPNEMVTMYYDQGGTLAMTHYCVFGNRPAMKLKSSDASTIRFDFDPTCGIDTTRESHMHSLRITFDDPNTITTSCLSMIDGTEQPEHPSTFKRVKD